ncbi:MAG: transposase [[Clostridium] scindens]
MYAIPFRIVRFPVSENAYEVAVTNLDKKDFPSELLKQLYAKRWGIETSFRDLKYTIGLLHFHSKKWSISYKKSMPDLSCITFLN